MSPYDEHRYYLQARFNTRLFMSRYRAVLSPVMDYGTMTRPLPSMTPAEIMRRLRGL
jgi:hypothetical protein